MFLSPVVLATSGRTFWTLAMGVLPCLSSLAVIRWRFEKEIINELLLGAISYELTRNDLACEPSAFIDPRAV